MEYAFLQKPGFQMLRPNRGMHRPASGSNIAREGGKCNPLIGERLPQMPEKSTEMDDVEPIMDWLSIEKRKELLIIARALLLSGLPILSQGRPHLLNDFTALWELAW